MSDKLAYKVIEYLNNVTGTSYSASYPETVQNINRLLSLGYGYDDMISVIDKKWNQWKHTKFKQYVRPSTLFGANFENYLNEPVKPSNNAFSKLAESVQAAKRHFRGMD
jgi:uncharacterized phage protein (TIGR02220 family)